LEVYVINSVKFGLYLLQLVLQVAGRVLDPLHRLVEDPQRLLDFVHLHS
jgi:hypothetical protein